MSIWPNSIPILKEKSGQVMLVASPMSARKKLLKPKPWINPKRSASRYREPILALKTRCLAGATPPNTLNKLLRRMVIGMRISTHFEGKLTKCKADSAKVRECPMVNAVINTNTWRQANKGYAAHSVTMNNR